MTDARGTTPVKVTSKPNYYFSWCVTDRKEIKFGYVWEIRKYSYLEEKAGEFLESSPFSASNNDKSEWQLVLYPRGRRRDHTTYVSLYLSFLGPVQEGQSVEMNAAFELSILDKNRNKMRIRTADKVHNFTTKYSMWGYERFIKRDELVTDKNGLIKNDTVAICCKIVMLTKPKTVSGNYDKPGVAGIVQDTGTGSRLTFDLGRLLTSKNFSDVVLVADDKELHAHKAFLASRSPVFAAMFAHDMQEKRLNRVVIADIAYNVLEELVRFIYTGKTPVMDEKMAMHLLAAADKYSLEDLKVSCEQDLSVKITSKNVAQLVRVAILHNANHLKAKLVEFVKSCPMDQFLDSLLHDLIIPQLLEGTLQIR